MASAADPLHIETPRASDSVFAAQDTFLRRHVGPRPDQIEHILSKLGYSTMDEFISRTVPDEVRLAPGDVDPATIPALSES